MADRSLADRASHAIDAAKEKVKETTHGGKSEVHQELAKDSHRPVTDRIGDTASAAKEKVKEIVHGGKKDFEKEKAKDNI